MIEHLKKSFFQYELSKYILVAVTFTLGIYLNWRVQDAVAFSVLVWLILKPVSNIKLLIATAGLFGLSILLLVIHRKDFAQDYSAYSFYVFIFLIISIIKDYLLIKKSHGQEG